MENGRETSNIILAVSLLKITIYNFCLGKKKLNLIIYGTMDSRKTNRLAGIGKNARREEASLGIIFITCHGLFFRGRKIDENQRSIFTKYKDNPLYPSFLLLLNN